MFIQCPYFSCSLAVFSSRSFVHFFHATIMMCLFIHSFTYLYSIVCVGFYLRPLFLLAHIMWNVLAFALWYYCFFFFFSDFTSDKINMIVSSCFFLSFPMSVKFEVESQTTLDTYLFCVYFVIWIFKSHWQLSQKWNEVNALLSVNFSNCKFYYFKPRNSLSKHIKKSRVVFVFIPSICHLSCSWLSKANSMKIEKLKTKKNLKMTKDFFACVLFVFRILFSNCNCSHFIELSAISFRYFNREL